jgi:hypothetical protein
MLALTMSFPCQVTGLTSPNPTVVTVKKNESMRKSPAPHLHTVLSPALTSCE